MLKQKLAGEIIDAPFASPFDIAANLMLLATVLTVTLTAVPVLRSKRNYRRSSRPRRRR